MLIRLLAIVIFSIPLQPIGKTSQNGTRVTTNILAIRNLMDYNSQDSGMGILCPFRSLKEQMAKGGLRNYEGSFFCETDVREVQGYKKKGKNHDHLREPEA